MSRSFAFALTAAWLVASPLSARAGDWCGNTDHVEKYLLFGDRRWEEPERGVDVFLERDASEDLPLSAQVRAVQDAVAAWDAIACSALRLRYAGVVSEPSALPARRLAVVRFSEDLSDEPRPLMAYTGVDDRDEDGYFVRTDIVLNGRAFAWRDDACGGGPDLAGVVTHELGHALGLAHSDVTPSIMANPWPAERTWQLRRPRADDVAAVCALYPCADGTCPPDPGLAVCRACIDASDCGDAPCVGGVCAPFCADTAACAAGFGCVEGALADRCEGHCLPLGEVCLPAEARVGLACAADTECGAPIGACDGERGVCALVCDGDPDCTGDRCVEAVDGRGAPVRLCRTDDSPRDRCSAAGPSSAAGWFALLLAGWYRRRRARLAVPSPREL